MCEEEKEGEEGDGHDDEGVYVYLQVYSSPGSWLAFGRSK